MRSCLFVNKSPSNSFKISVIFLNGSVPIKYGLRLNSESRYWDLKKHLSILSNLEPEKMLVCELANAQIKCVLPNDLKIKPSTAFELTCYEVPTLEEIQRAREDTADIATNIEQGLKDIQRNQGKGLILHICLIISIIFLVAHCYFISFCLCLF